MLDIVILFLKVSPLFCDSKTTCFTFEKAIFSTTKQLVLLFKQISLYAKACIFYCAPYVCKSEKMVSVSSIYVSYFQNSDT